ncbi:hypothetical protein QL285_015427 [Trifolium repens]|nr:hypothetical protein QL285_015427 [Trifolium repens]
MEIIVAFIQLVIQLVFGKRSGVERSLFDNFFRIYLLGNTFNREWGWSWCSELTSNEEEELQDLQQIIFDVALVGELKDNWRWIPENSGLFSIKSAYSLLLNDRIMQDLNPFVLTALQTGENDIPSKVGVFGWRLLLEKLPTRAALASRGILSNIRDLPCVFCFKEVEDCPHLFFKCHFMKQIWYKVFSWMGCAFSHFDEGWHHFNSFGDIVKSKRGSKVKHLIWLATT